MLGPAQCSRMQPSRSTQRIPALTISRDITRTTRKRNTPRITYRVKEIDQAFFDIIINIIKFHNLNSNSN